MLEFDTNTLPQTGNGFHIWRNAIQESGPVLWPEHLLLTHICGVLALNFRFSHLFDPTRR